MKVKQDNESEDLRSMRESIEEMEKELKGMEKDIDEAKKLPDPEMREVALRNTEGGQRADRGKDRVVGSKQ